MQHKELVRPARGQFVGNAAGAIRRIIVDDQNRQIRDTQRPYLGRHHRQIFGLIIRGNDDKYSGHTVKQKSGLFLALKSDPHDLIVDKTVRRCHKANALLSLR
jgi:hypothetical protein